MSTNPAKRFGIDIKNDFTVWKLDEEFTVDPEKFLSKGRATPFENTKLFGKCLLTVCEGKTAYRE